jgi:predicted small lipoprotein YifL
MQPSRIPSSLLLIAALCATLAACGGGGDDCPPAVDPPVETLPDINDCFTVKPGLRYTISDPDKTYVAKSALYTQEKFDGAVHPVQIEYFDVEGTSRAAALYFSIEADGVRFWGDYDYTPEGVQATKSVYTGFLVPKTLAPTQTVTIHYTDNNYFTNGGFLAEAEQETWTFEGHETLAMAGRSFPNACRFKVINDAQPSFGTTVVWAAPGYGPIQYKFIDVDGTVRGVRTLAGVTEP